MPLDLLTKLINNQHMLQVDRYCTH